MAVIYNLNLTKAKTKTTQTSATKNIDKTLSV
jgi:hypothetical protein